MDREKSILKKWLDKLQEESWNLELLISGFSIFALFKARTFLEYKSSLYFANDVVVGSLMGNFRGFFSAVYISVVILIVFLLLHIFFRGLWIGAIGIRYVSSEIDYGNLKYNPRLIAYLKKKIGKFDDYIIKLEKISSLIFGYTFLLVLVLCSAYFYLIFTALIVNGLDALTNDTTIWGIHQIVLLLMFTFAIFPIIDFSTGGLLKRIKNRTFVKVYMISNRIVTLITLSFLWKPLYYNIVDRHKTKILVYLIVPFFLTYFLLTTINYNAFSIFPTRFNSDGQTMFTSIGFKEKARYSFQSMFYDNLRRENEVIKVMSIKCNKIEHKAIELFVRLTNLDENVILQMDTTIKRVAPKGFSSHIIKKGDYEKELIQRKKKASANTLALLQNEQNSYSENLNKILSSAKKIYGIRINEIPLYKDSIDILFHKHDNLNEEGFLFLFYAENVKNGINLLTLEKLMYNSSKDTYDTLDFTIPFVYYDHQRKM